MPTFQYRGRNSKGALVSGRMEAAAQPAAADQLFAQGITPLAISISSQIVASKFGISGLRKTRVARQDLVLLFRQMYTLSRAGVPILRALAGLQESAPNPAVALLLEDMRTSLDSGRELSAAMARHGKVFSAFHINMIRVGEMTGRLEDIFLRLAQHLEFEHEMSSRVKSAMRYPSFVIAAMAIAVLIANVFIIPTFAKMFEGMKQELPVMTRLLIGGSDFTLNYWWVLVLLVVGAAFGFKTWIETVPGRFAWDRLKMRLPLAGPIVRQSILARFARGMSLSLRSGVPLVKSLDTVADVVDNAYLADRIRRMSAGVQRGESVLATAVASGIFSPVVLQMIAIGDETGSLDELLQEVATMYEREVEYSVRALAEYIEPILIALLAGFVLVLALGILTPMWQMNSSVIKH